MPLLAARIAAIAAMLVAAAPSASAQVGRVAGSGARIACERLLAIEPRNVRAQAAVARLRARQ